MKGTLKLFPDRAREVALKLREEYRERGIFGHRELPDDAANDLVGELSLEEGLLLVTLTTALDYMRNASELWKSSLKTFGDPSSRWVFNPEEVVRRGREDLREALLKHGLAKKKERDLEVWFTISKTLAGRYSGSVLSVFEEYGYDAVRMFEDFSGRLKEDFPSISGSKMFPHWIRSLKEKFNLPVKGYGDLPIPVDVHVARATFTTGCIRGKYSSKGLNETLKRLVVEVWREALKGFDFPPIEMFRPLWLLSKFGCRYRRGTERPKYPVCPAREFCVDGVVIVSSTRVEIDT